MAESSLATMTVSSGQHIRLYCQPLYYHQRIVGVVLVGAALSPLEGTLQYVSVELLVLAPLILVLGIVGSLWLAKRAFRPITRLTTIARTIRRGIYTLVSLFPIPMTKFICSP